MACARVSLGKFLMDTGLIKILIPPGLRAPKILLLKIDAIFSLLQICSNKHRGRLQSYLLLIKSSYLSSLKPTSCWLNQSNLSSQQQLVARKQQSKTVTSQARCMPLSSTGPHPWRRPPRLGAVETPGNGLATVDYNPLYNI